jgi:Rrf2 family protein
MRISQKLEYACRSLAQLAKHHDGRTITRLEELAQREAVSRNFLVQILNDLRRSGLVDSRRGKSGGYLLARAPDAITSLLECSVTRDGQSGQSVRQAWEQVSGALQRELDGITLDTLASQPGSSMFYI